MCLLIDSCGISGCFGLGICVSVGFVNLFIVFVCVDIGRRC